MSHEIEADYMEECGREEVQCKHCTSFQENNCYCHEAKAEVSPVGHCDFFQSRD